MNASINHAQTSQRRGMQRLLQRDKTQDENVATVRGGGAGCVSLIDRSMKHPDDKRVVADPGMNTARCGQRAGRAWQVTDPADETAGGNQEIAITE